MLTRRVSEAFFGGFRELRPAQQAAIEPLTAGRDVVLCSGTGSGKTEAVLAPLVSRYLSEAGGASGPTILYVAPTKALINDVERRMTGPLGRLGWRAAVRHGDRDDTRVRDVGQVLITTPESLDVMLFRGDGLLSSIRACVVDEAHLMFNSQRGFQLAVLLLRVEAVAKRRIQIAALSATVGDLSALATFIMGAHRQPDLLQFPSERPIDAQVRHAASIDALVSFVARLMSDSPTKLLCFANSRRECERIVDAIVGARVPCLTLAHYSSLSTEQRRQTEESFLAARSAICVATSTLELGIDIGDIDAVILWGAPGSVESFLQRIGRGNRRSHKSNVIAVVPDTEGQPLLEMLVLLAQVRVARAGRLSATGAFHLFGAIGQQCLAAIGSRDGAFTRISDLVAMFDGHPHANRETITAVMDELAAAGLCQRHGFQTRYGATDGFHQLVDLRMIYGNIPIGAQQIELRHRSQVLGNVPRINLLRLQLGIQLRFAGRRWIVSKVEADAVQLEPTKARGDAVDLVYGGAPQGMDVFLASLVWEQVHDPDVSYDCCATRERDWLRLHCEAIRAVAGPLDVPVLQVPGGLFFLTCAGYAVNRVLAHHYGENIETADDVGFVVGGSIDWALLPDSPEALRQSAAAVATPMAQLSIFQSHLPIDLAERERLQPWLKDPAVASVLFRLHESRPKPAPTEPFIGFVRPLP